MGQRKGADAKEQNCCRDRVEPVTLWIFHGKGPSTGSTRKLKIQIPRKALEVIAILASHCFAPSQYWSTILTSVAYVCESAHERQLGRGNKQTVSSGQKHTIPLKAESVLTLHRGPDLLCIRHSARLKSSGQGHP